MHNPRGSRSWRRFWGGLAPSVYFLFAAALALHCYRNPTLDIDLLAFAGNVALIDTPDLVQAHAIVYQNPLTPHLRGADADDSQARILRKRADDPYYSTLYLPYFSIKPLYVLALEVAHNAGANLVNASRLVSGVCFFGIAIAVWLYTRSVLAILILILPECMILGLANEPDGMSIMLLLFGLWAVFLSGAKLGILPLLIAVWVRPENSLLCMMVLALMWITGELKWRETAILAAVTAASEMAISHFGYGWRALCFHTFLGGEPGDVPQFTAGDYARALVHGLAEVLHSSAPIYVLLGTVCFIHVRDRKWRTILGIAALFSFTKFLLFPNYEPRYYGLYFMVVATSAVVALKQFVRTYRFSSPLGWK